MKNYISMSCLALFLFNACSANASVIVWGAAQDSTTVSDVSTNGSSVRAFNAGVEDVTVNGILFVEASPFTFAAQTFLGSGGTSTGDTDYDILLDQNSFNFDNSPNPNPDPTMGTIDLGAFVSGDTYEIQVFYTDQRPAQNGRSVFYGSGDGASTGAAVELFSDPNQGLPSPFGQFAIGTFVADGNDPDLVVTAGVGAGNAAQINGWQIRNITVPEPSAVVLLATLLGVCCVKRFRQG